MEPVAFLSYAHLDDAGSIKELSLFHETLQSELSIHTGLQVKIFFDKKSIGWGKRWAELIDKGLEGAAFLIPILTPAFFQSSGCRGEYAKFKEVEKRIGRRDLILPIYYVTCQELKSRESRSASVEDPIVDDIRSRQYRDWRELRHKPKDSNELLQEFAALASVMADTFVDIKESSVLGEKDKSERLRRDAESLSYIDEILNRQINYENLIAYTVETFPRFRVSSRLTRDIIKEMDKERYKIIKDIDREVKYAKAKVDEYAKRRPDKFSTSTDFISKTLIFVDSDFREVHSSSAETNIAAQQANITRY